MTTSTCYAPANCARQHQQRAPMLDFTTIPTRYRQVAKELFPAAARRRGHDHHDGPYIELKENLGGFYIIEARDLDETLEIAKRCPTDTGTEVRPIQEFN
ncbi:YciI family protein [Phytohabitans kaempferiae]|uniref:YciI family protein n=1 Tax=Phytohabitans kaempferiae TaxID=1620943 RepID=A0ABV6MD69_9ACTN